MAAAAAAEEVDLVVVGPEAPLVDGLVDLLAARGVAAFGPTREVAQLEGSKAFAKEVMEARRGHRDVAGGDHRRGRDGADRALSPSCSSSMGLAAGKGVVIAADEAQAREALEAFLVQERFGPGRVVVEEALEGEELSLMALCDGETAVPMAPAQDYKRIFDGDRGPNTGGMGSYSPVPGIDRARVEEYVRTIHQPVVDEMRHRGTPFHGCLYAGLMLTADGPRVLEFNVRFGDPETQAVLPRLRSDLLDLLQRARVPGGLAGDEPEWDERWAVSVVLASGGYPDSPSTGDVISGLDAVPPEAEVTHAGTGCAARRVDRDRRRTRPQRHRAGRRPGCRPRRRLCCRRPDHLRGPAAATRHRAAGRGAHMSEATPQTAGVTQTTPRPSSPTSTSTRRWSGSSWARSPTCPRWRRPARSSPRRASTSRCA
jgi:phosphoribosylamine--glycine ligase